MEWIVGVWEGGSKKEAGTGQDRRLGGSCQLTSALNWLNGWNKRIAQKINSTVHRCSIARGQPLESVILFLCSDNFFTGTAVCLLICWPNSAHFGLAVFRFILPKSSLSVKQKHWNSLPFANIALSVTILCALRCSRTGVLGVLEAIMVETQENSRNKDRKKVIELLWKVTEWRKQAESNPETFLTIIKATVTVVPLVLVSKA